MCIYYDNICYQKNSYILCDARHSAQKGRVRPSAGRGIDWFSLDPGRFVFLHTKAYKSRSSPFTYSICLTRFSIKKNNVSIVC